MVFVTIILALSVFLVYLDDKGGLKHGLTASFLLVSIFFSLRYAYGNDYFNYINLFVELNKYGSIESAFINTRTELGWVILCRLLDWFGSQSIIAVSTFLLNAIYYYLIYKFVPKGYRFYAAFMFLFHPSIFLLDLSMIRQGLAAAFMVLSMFYMYNCCTKKSIATSLVALSFHIMSLICIPFLLFVKYREYVNLKIVVMLLVGVFFTFMLNESVVVSMLTPILYSEQIFDEYGSYIVNGEQDSAYGLGFLLQLIVVLPFILLFQKFKEFDRLLLIFYTTMFIIVPMSFQLVLLGRLGSFFLPYSIFLFPRIYSYRIEAGMKLYNLDVVKLSIYGMMFYVLYSYIVFFSSDTYGSYYRNYHFIF